MLDADALRAWTGRSETASDLVTSRLVESFAATFAPHLAPYAASEAPLALHWCLAPPIAAIATLGADGHAAKGEFLPPVPLPRRMWAGGTVEAIAPLRQGDMVLRRSTIGEIAVKQGRSGTLCFVAVHHELSTERGIALRERHDIVYREAAAPGAGAPALPAAIEAGADLVWRRDADPVLLFRYSALTFNGHRIHYDEPYATREEGYAGLVVHGPIQATLLLNIAAALAGTGRIRLDYRGLSPLIAGTGLVVKASRETEGAIRCWTEAGDGRPRMEGRATVIGD